MGSKFLRVQIQVLAVALISSKTEETKNSQIKGEQHLIELNKSVALISEKFDEYEKVEKEITVKEMQKEMKDIPATILSFKVNLDWQEQYSRRNWQHNRKPDKDTNGGP